MTKPNIRIKLNNFLEEFKQEMGGFKSFEVIYDYIGFLRSEKYTKELLANFFKYAGEQKKLIAENLDNVKEADFIFNLQNLTVPQLPFFKKEFELCQEKINKNEDPLRVDDILAGFLSVLLSIYDIMHSIKNNAPRGIIRKAKNTDSKTLIQKAKDEAFGFQNATIFPDTNIIFQNTQMFAASIEIINKYIIDQIDAEEFQKSGAKKYKLSFDKEKSILNICGQEIKIQRKSDKPNDHYILEYLLEQENIFDEADFQDIAREKLGMKEYNPVKDWDKLRHACDQLNKKVEKSTNEQEKEFLKYRTGQKGWCKINPKYL
ncbi:MAG: hypothetical protein V1770_04975 [bacterium]